MSLKFLINLLIGHAIGCFYGFLTIAGFFIRAVLHPVKFKNELFNRKKRDTMPACLNDPTLGTHGFLHLEKVKIHYVACGDEGKPLMLLVHGFPEFWYSWRFQMRYFAKEYRVVAIDMRGYGDSDKPSGYSNYRIDHLVADIKQLVPALGYESCVLAGHDWGGAVVWAFAARHPDMVDQLIVLNCPHPATFSKYIRSNFQQFRKSWYMFFFQLPCLPELFIRWNDFHIFNLIFKSSPNLKKNATEEDIEAYKYCFSKPDGLTCPINYYRASFKTDPSKIRSMPVIRKPTLIIWGCKDLYINQELPALAEKYVSDLTIRYVQDANHFVNMDCPDQVNELMKEFLDQR